MTITAVRDRSGPMRQHIHVRDHVLVADEPVANGGEDAGPDPHDLYDAALGACKALTTLWYARRNGIPVEDMTVVVERDNTEERAGTYRLRTVLSVTGNLSESDRERLLAVASKCPLHKLMTQVKTEVETAWAQ
jgi:putative redox protein